MSRYRAEVLVSLGLAVTTVLVFRPACAAEFVNYDDQEYVYENAHVRSGLSWANTSWALTTFHSANWHPLTWLSLQLDASLFGPRPFGFHLTNVLLHAANSALLFCALRLLTGALWRSALVAGLFALHPLRVESVAWVAERKDVLCGLFFMLTLLAYGWYARRPGWRRYLPVALALALGLLAKPMLVTLPCLLLLLDYWPLRRLDAGWRPHVLEKLPLFVLAALSCLLTWQAQQRSGAIGSLESYSLGARLGNAVLAYAAYLGDALWPAGLTVWHPHPGETRLGWQAAGAAVVLAGVTALALRLRRRAPYLLVGWLWYLGMLMPVIGLVQVGLQARADRYTYLPLIGVFVAAAWGVADLTSLLRLPRWAGVVAAVAALAACAACTLGQLACWHDSIALWEHAIEFTPDSAFVQRNLGMALADHQQFERAIPYYHESLRHEPKEPMNHYCLGLALEALGRGEEAVPSLREAVRLSPGWALARTKLARALEAAAAAHNKLGAALEKQGKFDEAVQQYREALRLAPGYARAHSNLGTALARQGRPREAIPEFQEALRLDPDYAQAHYNLGLALEDGGEPAQALAFLRRAAALAPDVARFRLSLAGALARAGRPEEARGEYAAASRLNPRWPQEAARVAWALATHPDARARNEAEALALAEEACRASGEGDPGLLDVLGAAYAAAGRYDEAVAAAHRALQRAEAAGRGDLVPPLRQRLRTYQDRQPYRDPNLHGPAGVGPRRLRS